MSYREDETGTYAADDCVYWETNPRADCGGRMMLVDETDDGTTVVCENCYNQNTAERSHT